MNLWITADRIFDGRDLKEQGAVCLSGGRVAKVCDASQVPVGANLRTVSGILGPGFFDLQVNGGGGVLFNRSPTPEGILAIARAHRDFGTTRLLPTVITDAPEVLDRAASAMIEVFGAPGIEGIHIEGPHISRQRHGTHDLAQIRPLDARTLALVERLRTSGVPVLITLAPEAVAPGQIRALSEMGAVVSIGHSDASFEATRAASDEGVRLFTHLFNAMSQLESRAPGVCGAAILSDAYCSAIFDGIHVAPEMLKIAIAARPRPDRMIIVSDAMPTVGGPSAFDLYGQRIELRDGRLVNAQGSLAGAHLTMAGSIRNAVNLVGVSIEDAFRMATLHPMSVMGRETDAGLLGTPAEHLVVMDSDLGHARPLLDGITDAAAE